MKLKANQTLCIYSMGKKLHITAIFHSVDETNKYLATHRNEGVIAEFAPYVFVANLYDKGI